MKNQNETKLQKGDQVRTIYGKIETVAVATESQIVTYESGAKNNWYHPSKVWKI